MVLTPQSRRLLERFAEAGVRPFDAMSVLEARASVAAGVGLAGEPQPVARVEDLLVPGGAGLLPARVYDPAPGSRLPLLVFLHGGGWVTGGVELSDAPCRALALVTGAVVVSVEYRLSPETRHPGAAEDACAALAWLARFPGEVGSAGPVVVIGESAGGTLATAATLMLRDRSGPAVAGQVLLYPPLVPTRGSGFLSLDEHANGGTLTRAGMDWFWDHRLGPDQDGRDAYASPLLAPDLTGLPPALVVVAEHDLLRDEGLEYARRLTAAGVAVTAHTVAGVPHGFLSLSRALPEAHEVLRLVAGWLDDLLSRS